MGSHNIYGQLYGLTTELSERMYIINGLQMTKTSPFQDLKMRTLKNYLFITRERGSLIL